MTGYRKLIAAACGGIPPNEVDSFLENIREVSLRSAEHCLSIRLKNCSRRRSKMVTPQIQRREVQRDWTRHDQ